MSNGLRFVFRSESIMRGTRVSLCGKGTKRTGKVTSRQGEHVTVTFNDGSVWAGPRAMLDKEPKA